MRLLVRIAVPETEAAWLERALELSWTAFDREVATSEKGRPPRAGRRGLPRVRIVVRGRLERLAYETWERARHKLADEQGVHLTDAEVMEYAAAMILGTRRSGAPMEAREKIDDSIYRVVIQQCPDCEHASIRTEAGLEELDAEEAARAGCDAPGAAEEDDPHHEDKTPKWLRLEVLARDGWRCLNCHGADDLMAHHVKWRSRGGKTVAENLMTTCSWCHSRIHDGLMIVKGEAPHRLTITDRHGMPLCQAAPIANPAILRVASRPSDGSDERALHSEAKTPPPPAHRPLRLADVIGQARTVRALQVAVKAAAKRRAPVDHVLLLGGPGLGKTSLAAALAAEIGSKFHVANGAMLQEPEVLIALLRGLAERDVLFIDEIHALPRRAMESLYEAMEDGRISLTSSDGCGPADGAASKSCQIPLAPFTLVGATTEIGLLPTPFVSRFSIQEHLAGYADADLAAIVSRAAARDGIAIDAEAAPALAAVSRGSPRQALGLFRRTRDEALASDRSSIDRTVVRQALEAAGIGEDGLTPIERHALDTLARHGRPMGLARWAAASNLPASSLRILCEPELMRQGLIVVTPRGRMARAQLRAVARDGHRGGGIYACLPPLFATG